MKSKLSIVVAAIISVAALAGPVLAQSTPKHPKNTITQLQKARKKNHAVRQVTVSPKKSPGKHADNLSKNVNHEVNRESKDINHFFSGKKKK